MRLIQILDKNSVITKYTNNFTCLLILNELAKIFNINDTQFLNY